ncbi:MAG: NUDIX hydrolase [Bacteroidota bacterium]|jgi:8-oxo-dGTP diphosphatase|nr:MAG: NUDIX hydrolase [Bacteroidota bacterium]
MVPEIDRIYGKRVRVRACGICWDGDRVLVVNHQGLTDGDFWAPPGGGVEFGFSVPETITREFREETGLEVETGRHLCVFEYINTPLHAVELFFEVERRGGTLRTGTDPELPPDRQIITAARFMSFEELGRVSAAEKHGIFRIFNTPESLRTAYGYWKI